MTEEAKLAERERRARVQWVAESSTLDSAIETFNAMEQKKEGAFG